MDNNGEETVKSLGLKVRRGSVRTPEQEYLHTWYLIMQKYYFISLQLCLRNASDGSDEDDEDEDSEYGAMAEQLEGFLGDEADNDDQVHHRDEEGI